MFKKLLLRIPAPLFPVVLVLIDKVLTIVMLLAVVTIITLALP